MLAHDCQPVGNEAGAGGEGDADGGAEIDGVREGVGEADELAAGDTEARAVAEAAGSAPTEQPAVSITTPAASNAMSWVRRWADGGRFIGSLLGGVGAAMVGACFHGGVAAT